MVRSIYNDLVSLQPQRMPRLNKYNGTPSSIVSQFNADFIALHGAKDSEDDGVHYSWTF